MHTNLLRRDQLARHIPELLSELLILRLVREVHWAELEALANHGVGERVTVLHVGAVVLGWQQVRDGTSLGADSLGADLGRFAFGDTVEDVGELVLSMLADLLRAVGVLVVEGGRGSEGFDEGEVAL